MRHPEFPFTLSIAIILIVVALPSQIRRGNLATLVLIFSTLLLAVTFLVNTTVWAGNSRDMAPVWCDIATTIQFSWPWAASGAVLCLCMHLEWVSRRSGNSNRPYRTLVEIMLCFPPPLVSIPIRYTLAPSRYAIIEDLGCAIVFEYSRLWLVIVFVPFLLVTAATAVFAGMAVRNFIRFRKITQCYDVQSTITKFHFVRMLVTCVIIGVWPLSSILLYFFIANGAWKLTSWRGWASTHKHFQDIPQIPSAHQSLEFNHVYTVGMWMQIVSAYIVSGMLVCTEEVRRDLGMVRNLVMDKISCQRCRRRGTYSSEPPSNPTLHAEV